MASTQIIFFASVSISILFLVGLWIALRPADALMSEFSQEL